MDIRTGPEAADVEASWHSYPPRLCLNAVSRAFQYGDATHESQIQPLVKARNATDHWNRMPAQFKHPGSDAPKGAVIQCVGGDGHIFPSLGHGIGVSTDFPSKGVVSVAPIADILAHFSGNPLAGWGTWINGRAIQGIDYSTTMAASVGAVPLTGGIDWSPADSLRMVAQGNGWQFAIPVGPLAKDIMQSLKERGRYTPGVQISVDGDPRGETIKAIQRTLNIAHLFNGNAANGGVDGIPGPGDALGVQAYGSKAHNHPYVGRWDRDPERFSWVGFANNLREGLPGR